MRKPLPGLTLVELLIATAVLGILASVVFVNLNNTRRLARDSRRKADVTAYGASLNNYRLTAGNFFVTAPNAPCNLTGSIDPPTLLTDSGCTGALGRSYGQIALHSSSGAPVTAGGRQYANTSIAEALRQGGFLSAVTSDPLNNNPNHDDPTARDYVLVRCCLTGQQSMGKGGVLMAVWTHLEQGLSNDAEITSSSHACGGTDARPSGYPTYVYDFAIPFGTFDSNTFASSNASARSSLSSTGSCSAPIALAK